MFHPSFIGTCAVAVANVEHRAIVAGGVLHRIVFFAMGKQSAYY
jgi:hypothetical protein